MATDGPHRSGDSWFTSLYAELHHLANTALARESPGHSLQPTLLVNDTYLRLLQQRNIDRSDRATVLAAGATIIRRLLVDYARARKAKKRGGPTGRGVPLHVSMSTPANDFDLLELHDTLCALSQENSRAAEVVELKFFGGLTVEEIAGHLDVSIRTVHNDWRFAKAWLYRALGAETDAEN